MVINVIFSHFKNLSLDSQGELRCSSAKLAFSRFLTQCTRTVRCLIGLAKAGKLNRERLKLCSRTYDREELYLINMPFPTPSQESYISNSR